MKLCKIENENEIEISITPTELEILSYIALELRVPVRQLVVEALERGAIKTLQS